MLRNVSSIKVMEHVLIVANGEFLLKETLLEARVGKTVVALDGAAIKLHALGIMPDIVLGDFDSITFPNVFGITKDFHHMTEQDPPYHGADGVLIVPAKDQLHTDLTKAMLYCDEQQVQSITIVCALGGRLDHHEGAIRTLRRFYQKERPIWIHSDLQTLCFAKDDVVQWHGEIGDKCGILAFPEGSFSSSGLAYEAHDFPLNFGYSENICNAFRAPVIELALQGEALLVMPGILPSQRQHLLRNDGEMLAARLKEMSS